MCKAEAAEGGNLGLRLDSRMIDVFVSFAILYKVWKFDIGSFIHHCSRFLVIFYKF